MSTKKNQNETENQAAVTAPATNPETTEVPAENNTVEPVVRKAVVASATGLNLRRGPGLDVLQILPDGAELQMVEIPGDAAIEGWCPVITGDGNRGWVMDQYIRPLEG